MQDPLPRFAVLARRLLSAVKNFEHAIQGQTKAVTEATEAAHTKQGIPPTVRVIEGVEVRKNAEDAKEDRKYQIRIFRVASLALVVLLALAAMNVWQLNEMRKASWDSGMAARAAVDQAKLIRQQLVGTEAAVLDAGLNLSSDGQLEAWLNNTGMVTATDIHFSLEATENSLRSGSRIGAPLHFEPAVPPIGASKGFSKIWPVPWHPEQLDKKGAGSTDWPGDVTYIFRGTYSYQDGFGDRIDQEFCKEWLPDFRIVSAQQTTGGGGLYPCDDIAATVRSVQERQKKAAQGLERPTLNTIR
jgi:hypothetical protein